MLIIHIILRSCQTAYVLIINNIKNYFYFRCKIFLRIAVKKFYIQSFFVGKDSPHSNKKPPDDPRADNKIFILVNYP
jgi:hypothetical protein